MRYNSPAISLPLTTSKSCPVTNLDPIITKTGTMYLPSVYPTQKLPTFPTLQSHSPPSQALVNPSLNNPTSLARLDLINPSRDGNRVRDELGRPEKLDVVLNGLLELGEG